MSGFGSKAPLIDHEFSTKKERAPPLESPLDLLSDMLLKDSFGYSSVAASFLTVFFAAGFFSAAGFAAAFLAAGAFFSATSFFGFSAAATGEAVFAFLRFLVLP
ncbi:MAG TPA: hypothetical protein VK151_06240 [Fluviicola sp.]|nr:hypothetical protein [Fluviicola sp.]